MTLEEIRTQIDRVDGQIKELFKERMQLADQVAQVKAQTEDKIYKPDREQAIIEKQSGDMDPHLIMEYKALIRRIMEVSRKYQYGRTLQLRDCFPFSFETEARPLHRIAMVREELYLAAQTHLLDALPALQLANLPSANTYEGVAALIQSGQADAGLGVIEAIGKGVSDPLNSQLLRSHLYINECEVLTVDEQKVKLVVFSPVLTVTKDQNRVKLVFVAPNRSGALSSLLSMISDYGVNLTEIHSIPFRTGENWNYRFFAELGMNMLSQDAQALLFQLSQETQEMQLLGSYFCDGDFSA